MAFSFHQLLGPKCLFLLQRHFNWGLCLWLTLLPFQAPNRSVCIIGTVCSFISFVFALCFASSQVDQALRTHVALSVAPTPTNTLPGGIRTVDRISAAHELFLERNPENIIGSFVYESVPGTQSLRQQAQAKANGQNLKPKVLQPHAKARDNLRSCQGLGLAGNRVLYRFNLAVARSCNERCFKLGSTFDLKSLCTLSLSQFG